MTEKKSLEKIKFINSF